MTRLATILRNFIAILLFGCALVCVRAQTVPATATLAPVFNWRVSSADLVTVTSQSCTMNVLVECPLWDAPMWLEIQRSFDNRKWTPVATNAVQDSIPPTAIVQISQGWEPVCLYRFNIRTNL